MLTLQFKKLHDHIKTPTRAHDTDACMDIYSPIDITLKKNSITKVHLGFSVACPTGYKFCLYSRSGLASKGILLSNSVGIVDEEYRGEVIAALYNINNEDYHVKSGDRILQCALEAVVPVQIIEVDELNQTSRGDGGFGSTGK